MTKYPTDIDTDAELPTVTDNVSEVGSEALNAMKDAIIAIQRTLGESPHGATADLVTRLSASLNDDGTIKSSALVAAGLISLPVTNSMIGASAGITESKLDLDVATQTLQNQVSSNDIDIEELQNAIADLLNKVNTHIAGTAHRHETDQINLTTALTAIVATDLDAALVAMNTRFLDHADSSAVGAHQASNISVDTSALEVVAPGSTDVQSAIEDLDSVRHILFETHRDEMHANGFSNWANDRDGYNLYNKKLPASASISDIGNVIAGTRNGFEVDGYALSSLGVKQGDILVINSGTNLDGTFIIDDVGPRDAVGSKTALLSDQLEIAGTFLDGYGSTPVEFAIYGQSSVYNYKTNVTPTIHQSDVIVDSIQVARPNSAKVLSLGLDPNFIDSSLDLKVEVGYSYGATTGTRTITFDNLHYDRSASPATKVSVGTIVERINYICQNRTDGYGFPLSAYAVGDELLLSHNFVGDEGNYVKILSTGSGNFHMGLDGYGADVVDSKIFPTQSNYFYVNGKQYNDLASIYEGTAAFAASSTVTFSGTSLLDLGVKPGHILHVREATGAPDEVGSYLITAVTSTTVTVQNDPGFTAGTNTVEILHDALPLNDMNSNSESQLVECYITDRATLAYNERFSIKNLISNLSVVDISDDFLPEDGSKLYSTVNASSVELQLGSGKLETIPTDFEGKLRLYGQGNVEFIEVEIANPIGAGSADFYVSDHVDEEEVLEVCSVKIDGSQTLSDISDKRLFGSVGIDEIREDFVQAYIENPIDELRSDGVVRGLEIYRDTDGSLYLDGYFDPSLYPSNQGVVFLGGTVYVGGVRNDITTTAVPFPNTAGTYTVTANQFGSLKIVNETDYTLTEIIDGYAGIMTPLATVVHDGSDITSAEDRRFFINDLDDKVELILDLTNRHIGHFATVEAALAWVDNYPFKEKFTIRYVSDLPGEDIVIPPISKDLTLVLDGRMGSLTLNTPCKVISEGLSSRSDNHIDGYLVIASGCTELHAEGLSLSAVNLDLSVTSNITFEKCNFDGYGASNGVVSSTGSATGDLVFDSCIFESTSDGISLASNAKDVVIRNCKFSSQSAMTIYGNDIVVEGCNLTGSGFTLSATEDVVVKGCSFKDNTVTTGSVITASGLRANLSQNTFKGLTVSNSLAKAIDLSGATQHSKFNNNSVSGSVTLDGYIIDSSNGDVSNCVFDTVTWGTGRDIVADRFTDNSVVNSVNSKMLVAAIDVTSNTGLNSVTSKGASSPLREVISNAFASPINGYNVDINDLQASDVVRISNNQFSVASATVVNCIVFGATGSAIIEGNEFTGDASDISVALGSSTGNNIISGNKFTTMKLMSSTAGISNLSVTKNVLDDCSFGFQAGTNVTISQNIVEGGSQSIGGSAGVEKLIVSDNVWAGTLNLIPTTMTDVVISGNTFTSLVFAPTSTATGLILTGNNGDMSATTAFDASEVLITGNDIDFTTIENITFQDAVIASNLMRHSSADVEFTLASTGGGIDSNVYIQENIFYRTGATAIQISSLNPVRSFAFSENINNSGGEATIVFNSQINEAKVEENKSFNINVANGSNSSTISGNLMPNDDLTLASTCNSTSVSNNFVQNAYFQCNSTGGLYVANNTLTGDMDVLSGIFGTYSLTKAHFGGNYVTGDFDIMSAITSGVSSFTITSSVFTLNTCSSINIMNVPDATGITSSYAFDSNTITSNKVAVDINNFNSTRNYASATSFSYSGNSFKENSVDGYLNLKQADAASTAITIDNLSVVGNTVVNQIDFAGNESYENLDITSNSLGLGLTFTANAPTAGGDVSLSGIRVNNNISTGHLLFYSVIPNASTSKVLADSFVIDNNNIGGNYITFDVTDSTPTVTTASFESRGMSISGNLCARINLYQNIAASSGSPLFVYFALNISNNIFSPNDMNGGIYMYYGGAPMTLTSSQINGNQSTASANISTLPEAVISLNQLNANGSCIMSGSSVSGNTIFSWEGDIDSATISNTSFSQNVFSNFVETATVSCTFTSNQYNNAVTLGGQSNTIYSGNSFGALTLGTVSDFIFESNSATSISSDGYTEIGSAVQFVSNFFDNDVSIEADRATLSDLSFVGNYIDDGSTTVSNTGDIDGLRFVSNNCKSCSANAFTISSSGGGITNSVIDSNSSLDATHGNIAVSSATVDAISISSNILALDISLTYTSASTGVVISRNDVRDINIGNSDLVDGEVSGNVVSRDLTILRASESLITNNRVGVTLEIDATSVNLEELIILGNRATTLTFTNLDTRIIRDTLISSNIIGNMTFPSTAFTSTRVSILDNVINGTLDLGTPAAINIMKLCFNTITVSVKIRLLTYFQTSVLRSVFIGNYANTWTTDTGPSDINLDSQDRVLAIANTSSTDPGASNRIICNTATGSFSTNNTNEFTGTTTSGGNINIT